MSLNSAEFNLFILKLLEFILKHNVFLFDGALLLQVQGVAMGTSCAPFYANLHLGGWKRELFSDEELAGYLGHALVWLRYIDNICIIWDAS